MGKSGFLNACSLTIGDHRGEPGYSDHSEYIRYAGSSAVTCNIVQVPSDDILCSFTSPVMQSLLVLSQQ